MVLKRKRNLTTQSHRPDEMDGVNEQHPQPS